MSHGYNKIKGEVLAKTTAPADPDPERQAATTRRSNNSQLTLFTMRPSASTPTGPTSRCSAGVPQPEQGAEPRRPEPHLLALPPAHRGSTWTVGARCTNRVPLSPKPTTDALLAALAGLADRHRASRCCASRLTTRSARAPSSRRSPPGRPAIGLIPLIAEWEDRKTPLLIAAEQPKSPPAEAFRALRTSLQFMSLDEPMQVAAHHLARRRRRQDDGVGRPRLHDRCGGPRGHPGRLRPAQAADPRVLRPDQRRRVHLGAPGRGRARRRDPRGARQPVPQDPARRSDPAEPLRAAVGPAHRADARRAQAALRPRHLGQSTPLLPVSDAAVLAAKADGVLLVAASGISTKRDTARGDRDPAPGRRRADRRRAQPRARGRLLRVLPRTATATATGTAMGTATGTATGRAHASAPPRSAPRSPHPSASDDGSCRRAERRGRRPDYCAAESPIRLTRRAAGEPALRAHRWTLSSTAGHDPSTATGTAGRTSPSTETATSTATGAGRSTHRSARHRRPPTRRSGTGRRFLRGGGPRRSAARSHSGWCSRSLVAFVVFAVWGSSRSSRAPRPERRPGRGHRTRPGPQPAVHRTGPPPRDGPDRRDAARR